MARSRRWEGGLTLAVEALWWLSVAALVIAALLLVVVATHAAGGAALKLDFSFQLPSSAYHIASGGLGSSAAEVGGSSGQIGFARPRLTFVLAASVVLAVVAAWWLFLVHQLRRLLGALSAGEPFARQNALRLRRIGVAVVAFELAHALAVWGGGLYLDHVLRVRGVSMRSHFAIDVPVILLGLLLVALASAFRAGSELADEQALTV